MTSTNKDWTTNSLNTNTAQYLKKKSYTKCGRETTPRPLYEKSDFSISVFHYCEFCFYFILNL